MAPLRSLWGWGLGGWGSDTEAHRSQGTSGSSKDSGHDPGETRFGGLADRPHQGCELICLSECPCP